MMTPMVPTTASPRSRNRCRHSNRYGCQGDQPRTKVAFHRLLPEDPDGFLVAHDTGEQKIRLRGLCNDRSHESSATAVRSRHPADPGRLSMPRQTGRRLIATNRKARHEFTILKTYEAGIVLVGTEVKSARAGRVSIVEAFAQERDGEIVLHGLHIADYSHGNRANHQPRRTRKLLLHRAEIGKILLRLQEVRLTLVPLSMYFENGWAKVELAIARGKTSYDKRQTLAERDANREIARHLGQRLKGTHQGRV